MLPCLADLKVPAPNNYTLMLAALTHSSTLTWKIPWMEERGRLQSMGSQRVGRDWMTSLTHWLHCLKTYMGVHALLSCFSCVWFLWPHGLAHEAPLFMGFLRQEYWSGLPCPPPGDLPEPGIKLTFLTSSALAGRFFIPLVPPGKP